MISSHNRKGWMGSFSHIAIGWGDMLRKEVRVEHCVCIAGCLKDVFLKRVEKVKNQMGQGR